MAEKEYKLATPAEMIDKIIKGAVVSSFSQDLTPEEQATAIENLGIDVNKLRFHILGYFDTLEELQATVTAPSGGESYGVGLAAPYDVYTWDELRGRWVNNGPLRGQDGEDANVTYENIVAALGFVPADAENVGVPDGAVTTPKIANGAVTAEKLAEGIELGITITKAWENAKPTSSFAAQSLNLSSSGYNGMLITSVNGGTVYIDLKAASNTGITLVDAHYATGSTWWAGRDITVTTSKVTFKSCVIAYSDDTLTENNSYAVPKYIYLVKGIS